MVKPPVPFQQEPIVATNGSSAKRKRAGRVVHDGDEPDAGSSSDHAESDPDAEEIKGKRRRVAKPTKQQKAPNNDALKLAMRPATNGTKRSHPTKPRKIAAKKRLPQDL